MSSNNRRTSHNTGASNDTGRAHKNATVGNWLHGRWIPVLVVALLGVSCMALLGLAVVTPPKVSKLVYDSSDLVNRAGEAVVLVANEQLQTVHASQVKVSPATTFTVQSQGNEVLIRFATPLRYGERYSIAVRGARSPYSRAAATLRGSITTPDATLATLDRSANPQRDQIIQTTVGGDRVTRRSVIYQTSNIQEFATLPGATLVVTRHTGRPALVLVRGSTTNGKSTTRIDLPADTQMVSDVRANVTARRFGFVVTTKTHPGAPRLFTLDALAKQPHPTLAPGFGKRAINIADWRFVPGTGLMLVQSTQGQLVLVDPAGGTPKPLGLINGLGQFIPGTLSITVSKGTSDSILDLAAGGFRRRSDAPVPASFGNPSTSVVLNAKGLTLQLFVGLPGTQGVMSRIMQYLGQQSAGQHSGQASNAQSTDAHVRTLVTDHGETSRVRDLCASPNGQYVAVEYSPVNAVSDGDAVNPGVKASRQSIISTTTGRSMGAQPGLDPSWCR